MEANAALRNIVRRDNGEGYREMLERLARESGVETPTAENLARLDRKRKGKKLSNTDWVSKSDPEAKIAKMKDGTTHLAYKPEHRWIWTPARWWRPSCTRPMRATPRRFPRPWRRPRQTSRRWMRHRRRRTRPNASADKGYHSRAVLRALNDSPWKTRIAAPKQTAFRAGTVMRRRGARSPTTVRGSSPGSPARPSSCAPRSSSAALPTTSIVAACDEPGCAGERMCTSDTCSTSPATIYRY